MCLVFAPKGVSAFLSLLAEEKIQCELDGAARCERVIKEESELIVVQSQWLSPAGQSRETENAEVLNALSRTLGKKQIPCRLYILFTILTYSVAYHLQYDCFLLPVIQISSDVA